jgi:Domain of unknown function (DUF4118)
MLKRNPAARWMAATAMRYGLVVLCLVAAVLVTKLLQFFLDGPPWFVFLAGVMISSWVAGLGLGLLAVLLSTLAIDYFFVPPLHRCPALRPTHHNRTISHGMVPRIGRFRVPRCVGHSQSAAVLSQQTERHLLLATLLTIGVTLPLPYTPLGEIFAFRSLPVSFLLVMGLIVGLYTVAAELTKKAFYTRIRF